MYCYVCKIDKASDAFHKNKSRKSGLHGECKKCVNAKSKQYYQKHKFDILKNKRVYALDNVENIRDRTLTARYGITREYYHTLFLEQNGLCAICGQPEMQLHSRSKRLRKLCVDHNHVTGKVRGLLCFKCNSAIGFLKEDRNTIIKALEYLEKYKD